MELLLSILIIQARFWRGGAAGGKGEGRGRRWEREVEKKRKKEMPMEIIKLLSSSAEKEPTWQPCWAAGGELLQRLRAGITGRSPLLLLLLFRPSQIHRFFLSSDSFVLCRHPRKYNRAHYGVMTWYFLTITCSFYIVLLSRKKHHAITLFCYTFKF